MVGAVAIRRSNRSPAAFLARLPMAARSRDIASRMPSAIAAE